MKQLYAVFLCKKKQIEKLWNEKINILPIVVGALGNFWRAGKEAQMNGDFSSYPMFAESRAVRYCRPSKEEIISSMVLPTRQCVTCKFDTQNICYIFGQWYFSIPLENIKEHSDFIFSFRKFSVLMMILGGIKKIDWKLISNFM